jgi:hypothetical protein
MIYGWHGSSGSNRVPQISKSAGRSVGAGLAGWETRDTADLEVGGTELAIKYSG